MNYLTLCDTLIKEAGLAEEGILSVTGQKGIKKKVVTWVSNAWVEIQNKRDWNFLWSESSFATIVDKQSYHPVDDLALDPVLRRWSPYSLIHSTPTGDNKFYLKYILWENFDNTLSSAGTPTQFTIRPDNSIKFNSVPDVIGKVSFEYTRAPQVLSTIVSPATTANDNSPNSIGGVTFLPIAHTEVILYQAMLYLAAEQDAPELYQDASRQLATRMADLAAESMPNPSVASVPLA
jgi:hypothetical protein